MEESVGGAPSVSAVLLEEMVVVLVSPPNKELKKADMGGCFRYNLRSYSILIQKINFIFDLTHRTFPCVQRKLFHHSDTALELVHT